MAAYTIQAADALHAAIRTGNPALFGHAVAVYEHARRLYAQTTPPARRPCWCERGGELSGHHHPGRTADRA